MTWKDRNRPADWEKRRARVLERDGHACQVVLANGKLCGAPANQVHHRIQGDDHSEENLAAVCEWHHRRITSAQGNAARTRVRQTREPERHPGLK